MKREPYHAWWLFLLCALAEACLAIQFFLQNPDGSLLKFKTMMIGLGFLAMSAGVLTIVAAIWNKVGYYTFFLVSNGLMYCLFGILLWTSTKTLVSFSEIASIVSMMALSLIFYLRGTAKLLVGHIQSKLQILAGGVSCCFTICFIAFTRGWFHLDPTKPLQSFYLLGSYFLFSALCKYFPIYRLWLQMKATQTGSLQTTPSN